MASLYFTYAVMNAGKSTAMLQVAYNYEERHQTPFLMLPAVDTRAGFGKIESRLGISRTAYAFQSTDNLFELIQKKHNEQPLDCLLIDEAQFLTEAQVWQLTWLVDELNLPVMCYGLRTDAFGQTFEGSRVLLSVADKLTELKTVCFCGRKATMTARFDAQGHILTAGEQVHIGGNEQYRSFCRKHWLEARATTSETV